MYRLHLDIPAGLDQEVAILRSKHIVAIIEHALRQEDWGNDDLIIGYRVGDDNDRGAKNYLDINENGHASSKKLKITI